MPYIYGELKNAQLERLAADLVAATANSSRIYYLTSDGRVKVSTGAAIRSFLLNDDNLIVGRSATAAENVQIVRSAAGVLQFLIGSAAGTDGAAGTAANYAALQARLKMCRVDDAIEFTEQASAPASPSSGYRRLYFKTDGKLYSVNSSGAESLVGGSSAGGINYVTNPDAETNTTGFSTYADAAATSPVDGTGGTPTVTITRSTASPLRGTGQFRLVKDAANRQGEGVSYAFTIDTADQAKVIQVSFDYRVSANFVSGSDSATGDLVVYVYDVTNAVLLQLAPYKIPGGSTGTHKFQGVFQAASNSTSYRLILHISGTTASAWDFDFDNVTVGPQQRLFGAPITDWVSYVPTISGLGTGSATATAQYRRLGDSMEIVFSILKDGSGGSGAVNVSFPLPSGHSLDTAKLPATATHVGSADNNGTSAYVSTLTGTSTTTLYASITGASFAAATILRGMVRVPIAGWGSGVVMSSDADSRIVAARVTGDPASSASGNPIIFPTVSYDTHGGYSASTGLFTVPVGGFYRVHGFVSSATATASLRAYVDGVDILTIGVTDANGEASFTGTVNATAGQTISLRSSAGALDLSGGFVCFERIAGPATIAASELVAAHYRTTAGQSIPNNTMTIVDMGTKVTDTHGAVTTGASWKFTAPVAGKYLFQAQTQFTGAASTAETAIYKNGSQVQIIQSVATSTRGSGPCVVVVDMVAGDYVDCRVRHNSGGSLSLESGAGYNWISVARVGT